MKHIKSISISNSKFFQDGTTIEFSSKLNCIMGGRGTGKSTLLHFIEAAIQQGQGPDGSLLRNNLDDGKITLVLEGESGSEFKIVRTLSVEPLIVNSATNNVLTFKDLVGQIECDIYPALSIESIGTSSQDRLGLIDKRIQGKILQIRSDMREVQISLQHNAGALRKENAQLARLKDDLAMYATAADELASWKKAKSDKLTEAEQTEFEKAEGNEKVRNSEARFVKSIVKRFDELRANLDAMDDEINRALKAKDAASGFINKSVTDPIATIAETSLLHFLKNNDDSRELLVGTISTIEEIAEPLKALHQAQQAEYTKLKQKLEQHREYMVKYNELNTRVQERSQVAEEIKEVEAKQKALKTARAGLLGDLNLAKKELFNLRKQTVDQLNAELGGHVKITLTFGGITEEYENMLRNALKGSNLRYNAIIPNIIENFTPDRFAAAIHDCNEAELKKVSEIDAARAAALIKALHEHPDIYKLEGLYVEDLPEFFLKVEERGDKSKGTKENFKKSDELSTGQRCTAVLPIVFAVSDNPLIIDQPEDNLDNEFINETVRKIVQEQKHRRQLIFITHNPNIPVVSDAEFNVFLNYAGRKSHVSRSGTVDEVKDCILALLEGGKEAFKKRSELYSEIQ